MGVPGRPGAIACGRPGTPGALGAVDRGGRLAVRGQNPGFFEGVPWVGIFFEIFSRARYILNIVYARKGDKVIMSGAIILFWCVCLAAL
jgi:hypothetical protein